MGSNLTGAQLPAHRSHVCAPAAWPVHSCQKCQLLTPPLLMQLSASARSIPLPRICAPTRRLTANHAEEVFAGAQATATATASRRLLELPSPWHAATGSARDVNAHRLPLLHVSQRGKQYHAPPHHVQLIS